MYPVKPDRSEVYFVTSQAEPGFNLESWSAKGDVNILRAAFAGLPSRLQPRAGGPAPTCTSGRWSIAIR